MSSCNRASTNPASGFSILMVVYPDSPLLMHSHLPRSTPSAQPRRDTQSTTTFASMSGVIHVVFVLKTGTFDSLLFCLKPGHLVFEPWLTPGWGGAL